MMRFQKILTLSMALLVLGGCSPIKPTSSNAEPDLSTSEGLVQAVFHALKSRDAQRYLTLTAHTKEELQVIFDMGKIEPTDAEMEEFRQLRKDFFNDFIVMVENQGIDLEQTTIKEIRPLPGGAAAYENFVLVVQDGATELEITLDDCLLFPRGWLIVDQLRLNE